MKAIQALGDLLVIAFFLFYIGMSMATNKPIIAVLCLLPVFLAWNHLQCMRDN
jgi:hypothetical protein